MHGVCGLKGLLLHAECYDVKVALEVYTGIAQMVDALLDVLDQVVRIVKVCFDPPLLAIRGEDAYNAVMSIGRCIVHVHIADLKCSAPLVEYEDVPELALHRIGQLVQVPLGDGIVDVEPFVRACVEFDLSTPMAF